MLWLVLSPRPERWFWSAQALDDGSVTALIADWDGGTGNAVSVARFDSSGDELSETPVVHGDTVTLDMAQRIEKDGTVWLAGMNPGTTEIAGQVDVAPPDGGEDLFAVGLTSDGQAFFRAMVPEPCCFTLQDVRSVNGQVLIAGNTSGTFQFGGAVYTVPSYDPGPEPSDPCFPRWPVVAAFNPDGSPAWSDAQDGGCGWNSASTPKSTGVVADSEGDILWSSQDGTWHHLKAYDRDGNLTGTHAWLNGCDGYDGMNLEVGLDGGFVLRAAGLFDSSDAGPAYSTSQLSAQGDVLSSQRYGGNACAKEDAALDRLGTAVVGNNGFKGIGQGPLYYVGQLEGGYVGRLDPNGVPVWSRTFRARDASTGVWLQTVSTFPDGDLLVTGEFLGMVDFGSGWLDGGANGYSETSFLMRLSNER